MMHFMWYFNNQEGKHQQVFRMCEKCRKANCSIDNMQSSTTLVCNISESQRDFKSNLQRNGKLKGVRIEGRLLSS